MSYLGIFNWDFWRGKTADDNQNVTKKRSMRPAQKDVAETYTANIPLTRGVYRGTYAGLRLISGLARRIVLTPVDFMGFPSFKTPDQATNEWLKEFAPMFNREFRRIQIQKRRDGTVWVYPKYDRELKKIIWELFDDDTITDIQRSLENGKVRRVINKTELTVSIGEDLTQVIQQKRIFTESAVEVVYFGSVPEGIRNRSGRNPAGVVPINFAHESESNDLRGQSAFEPIIPALKSLQDLISKEDDVLGKFNPKLLIPTSDVDKWLSQNGFDDIDSVDVYDNDLFFYSPQTGQEPISMLELKEFGPHQAAIKSRIQLIIMGTGLPEIVFGLELSGNHASVGEQMTQMASMIFSDQHEMDQAYASLMSASIRLFNLANFTSYSDQVETVWDDLDSVSETSKAEIFAKYAEGWSKLGGSAMVPIETLFAFIKQVYPKVMQDMTIEKFKIGLDASAKHAQFVKANYVDAIDVGGTLTE